MIYPGAHELEMSHKSLTSLMSDSVIQLLFQSEFQAALHMARQHLYTGL